ncbi:hypothetical protein H5410_032326 [Solanum commersonii]|uniref:Uncharacterized protein n=1 Tax=Solanum commersonii TaxID=4109 RepID=A0A9J5YPC9_SOLCO|nr:hypothetical protein H5410_032326 [Solanum commersonii]
MSFTESLLISAYICCLFPNCTYKIDFCGGDTLILGFKDFVDRKCAFTALSALQGEQCQLLFWRPCFVIFVALSLVFAETIDVTFAINLSIWTMMDCAQQAYMAGIFGGSINLDPYICKYVAFRADIEKIWNVSICILRGSQKNSRKELLHCIESIKERV